MSCYYKDKLKGLYYDTEEKIDNLVAPLPNYCTEAFWLNPLTQIPQLNNLSILSNNETTKQNATTYDQVTKTAEEFIRILRRKI